MSVSKLYHFAS